MKPAIVALTLASATVAQDLGALPDCAVSFSPLKRVPYSEVRREG